MLAMIEMYENVDAFLFPASFTLWVHHEELWWVVPGLFSAPESIVAHDDCLC